MRWTLGFNRDAGWRPRAAWQGRRTLAPADAAGCRVYEERFLRAMIKYGRNSGNLNGSDGWRSEQVWKKLEENELFGWLPR